MALLELKSAVSEGATLQDAFQQVQNYTRQLPTLFAYYGLVVISDGLVARVGTLTSNWERFAPWRTVDGRGMCASSWSLQNDDVDKPPGSSPRRAGTAG